jgi:sigma-B regulation protein RsbU (phosphoserine phosphatase)
MYHLMAPASGAAARLQLAQNFFVAIPAFLFFGETGAAGRIGRALVNTVCIAALVLIALALLGFPFLPLDRANSILIIAGSASLLFLALRKSAPTRDEIVFRVGLMIFVALVLWGNISDLLGHPAQFEFYGFAALLCCLGYIAARRTLDRDQQLNSIQKELDIARSIQMSILPAGSPNSNDFCIATRYKAMTSVAGDFYDFLHGENGSLGLLVADVSGHGVPAALIASMVKVAVQSQRHQQNDPASLLAAVNQALCGNAQNQFVTAAYAYLDARTAELRYAGAGHPPLLLLRNNEVLSIEENGLVLALMPSAVYTSRAIHLERGDRILLYTDGILEPINAAEEEFGHDRLAGLLKQSAMHSPDEAAETILNAVTAWSVSQQDDLTIMICDYKKIPDQ